MTYKKPEHWADPAKKIYQYQVGFTAPPHDFDAAPSDFLRMSGPDVGVHGRMLHVPDYKHALDQRVDNFTLLEEYVECMANNGADVCGQVGSNWAHAGGKSPNDIRDFLLRIADTYQTPLHMSGYAMVEALRSMGVQSIAINGVYHWPDWWEGSARFLAQAGFDIHYAGNFVDQGLCKTQQECNDHIWIFPMDYAQRSFEIVNSAAPEADVIIALGMCNFRENGGLTHRILGVTDTLEQQVGKPVIGSDTALYWQIYKTLGARPERPQGQLLRGL